MNQLIKKIILTTASIFLLCSIVFALQQYGTNENKAPGSVPAPSHVMTSEEFSSKVNAIKQQTKTTLAQQVTETLPKQSGKTSVMQPPASTSSVTTTTSSSPTSVPVSPAMPAPTNQVNVSTQPPAGETPPPPAATSSTVTSTVTTAPSSPQNQTYTGFVGSGDTNTKSKNTKSSTTKSSTGDSGSWNIHY